MRSHLNTVCLRTRLSNSEFGVRSLCERSACCQDSDCSDASNEIGEGKSGAKMRTMGGSHRGQIENDCRRQLAYSAIQ